MASFSSLIESISSRLDEDEMVELAVKLIEKNTVNPPGNEYLVKDILIEALQKIGARIKTFEPSPGRSSIVGFIGEGAPVFAIISHMDVVPPGEGWDFDPFSPIVKDGKIYGRGAVDNKGPFAASYAGIKALLKSGISLKGTLVLGAVADEEKGSLWGMQHILDSGFGCDFCIIPDGGELDRIIVGEKGRMEVCLKTRGKSAHASQPQKGENAIYKMVDYLSLLKKSSLKGPHHPLFDAPTINLGEIKGGQAPNIVPDVCEAVLDIRFPLGMEEELILSYLQSLSVETKVEVEVEKRKFSAKPHLLDLQHPFVRIFKEVARELNIQLSVGTMGGITLAKNFYFHGIPAIVHSPAEESVAHQANEYVKIKNLAICAKLWAAVAGKLLENKEG
ncbi:M20 family metallopeptidase [Candidatus Aerophobetes bacterium]|nr:M20 family metallopeptidase [Candidatus Aerophobetes bacterium]